MHRHCHTLHTLHSEICEAGKLGFSGKHRTEYRIGLCVCVIAAAGGQGQRIRAAYRVGRERPPALHRAIYTRGMIQDPHQGVTNPTMPLSDAKTVSPSDDAVIGKGRRRSLPKPL